jgi:hypothetical protein
VVATSKGARIGLGPGVARIGGGKGRETNDKKALRFLTVILLYVLPYQFVLPAHIYITVSCVVCFFIRKGEDSLASASVYAHNKKIFIIQKVTQSQAAILNKSTKKN